jgi:phage terminase large subunit
MLVADIIAELKPYQGMTVICDSADPRLIQEIFNAGILIYPVIKGGGSILAGIEKMKDMEIFVTKDSLNLQHELRNYVWDKDKDGNYINKPVDRDNHCIDSVRYWVLAQLLGQITKTVKFNTDSLGIF